MALPGFSISAPEDCADGFQAAYWKRPGAYLDPEVRQSISSFSGYASHTVGLTRLAADIDSGAWARINANILEKQTLDAGYRIVVADIRKSCSKPGL